MTHVDQIAAAIAVVVHPSRRGASRRTVPCHTSTVCLRNADAPTILEGDVIAAQRVQVPNANAGRFGVARGV